VTTAAPVSPVPPAPRPPSAAGAPVQLHTPDEPEERRDRWRDALLGGADLDDVVTGTGGVSDWLWARWRVLERAGMDRAGFDAVVSGYRRELWLWLVGDRTWAPCCAGMIGRVERRLGP
jgi:hypothetical protein